MPESQTDAPVDRLDALLRRFTVRARMFHSGALCGIHDIPTAEVLYTIVGGKVLYKK